MRKGFTLVELLIVLAVIAALMAVATPLALNAVRNAKASQVAQNFRNIRAAVENYVNVEKPDDATKISLENLVGKYLSAEPSNFSVSATLENGIFNVKISYRGGDVEASRVQSYYKEVKEEVKEEGKELTLEFEIQKWW